MIKRNRLEILRKIAQTTPTIPSSTTTTPTPVVVQNVSLRALPNFKVNLFSARPDIVNDIDHIVNIINKHLTELSGGKVTFNIVWNNPSITGSEFSNSTKNLVNLSKWIYNVVKANSAPYSLDALKQIGHSLIDTVKSYSFPEPNASGIQNELVVAGQVILNKLG